MSIGYIYCMTNSAMPGLVKIGMTLDHPEERAAELSSVTGVPARFEVAISKRVVEPEAKEAAIHDLLSRLGYRFNERREFFTCGLEIVGLLFAVIDGVEVEIGNAETIAVHHVRPMLTVEKLQ